MRIVAVLAVLGAISAYTAPSASGQLLFDNFGPENSYVVLGGWGAEQDLTSGMAFQPSSTACLESLHVAISSAYGSRAWLGLYDDAEGIPGRLLESFDLTSLMDLFGYRYDPIVLRSSAQPLLVMGSTYYLVPYGIGDHVAVWNLNSINDIGPIVLTQDGGTTWHRRLDIRGAFRVVGIPVQNKVPEPGAWAFMVAGATGGLLLLRRRK